MAELKILGAQRVKALIEVLNKKRARELDQTKKALPSMGDVKAQVDARFGVDAQRKRLVALVAEADALAKAIKGVTGEDLSVKITTSYYSSDNDTVYAKEVEATFKREYTDVIAAVEAKYKELEDELWLCETLEDAKKIVGM